MRYALVVFENDASRARISADPAAHRAAYQTWIAEVAGAGKLVGGEALDTAPPAPTHSVRRGPDGSPLVQVAPVHAAEETLGGWFVLDVADADEALGIARSFPTPETLELRPLLESA